MGTIDLLFGRRQLCYPCSRCSDVMLVTNPLQTADGAGRCADSLRHGGRLLLYQLLYHVTGDCVDAVHHQQQRTWEYRNDFLRLYDVRYGDILFLGSSNPVVCLLDPYVPRSLTFAINWRDRTCFCYKTVNYSSEYFLVVEKQRRFFIMGENVQIKTESYVLRKLTYPELGEHCYAIKVSPCGQYFAVTFGNGCIRVVDVKTYEPLLRCKLGVPYDDLPSTCVKWGNSAAGNHTLVSASAAGVVFGWLWEGETYAERLFRLSEEKNDTATMDVSLDGQFFATGGSDRSIRVYSIDEKKCVQVLNKGVDAEGHSRVAHNNRIFSVRFVSPTTLVSGGWESPIQVWDLRTGRSERQITGSQIGADSIEPIHGTTRIIAASNRGTQQLQVYDYITCREIEVDSARLSAACGKVQLSGVRYCAATKSVWVICMKPHTVMQIDYATGNVLGVVECKVPVMSIDVSTHHPGKVFIACMNETVFVVESRSA